MKKEKTILVVGGTGMPGSSVVKSLLERNMYSVRIFTRDATAEKAERWKAEGAELVEGDLDNMGSLMRAMKDCYGVYGDIHSKENAETGLQQGKNLINAVQLSGIQHFVFHTTPDYAKRSEGSYSTRQSEISVKLQQYAKELRIPFSFIQPALYYENFFSLITTEVLEDGSFQFGIPMGDTKLAMVSMEDLGGVVTTLFDHPLEYIGRTVGMVGTDATCAKYAYIMSHILRRTITYKHIPSEGYVEFSFPGAKESARHFDYLRRFVPERLIDMIESYGLNPKMQHFENWLLNNRIQIDHYFESELEKAALTVAG